MDTKFSAGGDGSHPGKHGIAAQTGCSKTAFSAAPHTCFSGNFAIVFIFVAYTDLGRYFKDLVSTLNGVTKKSQTVDAVSEGAVSVGENLAVNFL